MDRRKSSEDKGKKKANDEEEKRRLSEENAKVHSFMQYWILHFINREYDNVIFSLSSFFINFIQFNDYVWTKKN